MMMNPLPLLAALGRPTAALLWLLPTLSAQVQVSGIYPGLAMFNDEMECGTGAVVPFADRLWVITYAPHAPRGSSDKLYEIRPDLSRVERPESIGGTPAERLLHEESGQLLIGPYVIDSQRRVRTIPYERMPGRRTGAARHLFEPQSKVYVATMEEGLYELDLHTLEVVELYADAQSEAGGAPSEGGRRSGLPGYHGKGLYSGQGRLVYANNGENSPLARARPDVPSGCLAEWDGRDWQVVARNQFTEVSGPGGIRGNPDPAHDPLWAVGWDHRSLLLMLRDPSGWRRFRLPKASHSYDGAHGWNTEWPRIRDIGEGELLLTMHGCFWAFPRNFGRALTSGIRPRSNYLKVIADFCSWRGRVVLGCDDTARNEFLNQRRAKGSLAGPGQSHSNLWFVEPKTLDALGPVIGRGALWLNDDLSEGELSDPFLFAGYEERALFLVQPDGAGARFTLEVDRAGDGAWRTLEPLVLDDSGSLWHPFAADTPGTWIRLRAEGAARGLSAVFHYAARDARGREPDPIFTGLARLDARALTGAHMRVRGERLGTLAVAARVVDAEGLRASGYYELDARLRLSRREDPAADEYTRAVTAVPSNVLVVDAASVLYQDDEGRRWRLPKGDAAFDRPSPLGRARIDREVVTERDLFHAHGSFYELPARNAGGFAKLRPIASHHFRIDDYCAYRGLLVLSGLEVGAETSEHVIRSDDGALALWVGAIDDLWRLGKPRGQGGPWAGTRVLAGEPSDPYLLTGYDHKSFAFRHDSSEAVSFLLEVDATGEGLWLPFESYLVPAGEGLRAELPDELHAYWLRLSASADCVTTAQFEYR